MRKTLNILLDIDQTLISAERYKETKENVPGELQSHNMLNEYMVVERPGLQEFLDYIFENFNVSIWTAASKDYALFIYEKVIHRNDKKRNVDYFFVDYHCGISRRVSGKYKSKDISLLWNVYYLEGYNKYNTVILDDNDEVYNSQTKNCIRVVPPFYFLDKECLQDKFLYNLVDILKSIKWDECIKKSTLQNCIVSMNKKIKNLKPASIDE